MVDGGGRRSINIGQVTIIVRRNEGAPAFVDFQDATNAFPLPYTNNIMYTATVNTYVMNVLATDSDVFNIIRYKLRTDPLTDKYFDIDAITGAMFLRDNLTNAEVSTRTQFNVSILLCNCVISQYMKNIQEYTRIYKNIQEYTRIYKNIQEYTRIYKNISSFKLQPYLYILKKLQSTIMPCPNLECLHIDCIYKLADGVRPGQHLLMKGHEIIVTL